MLGRSILLLSFFGGALNTGTKGRLWLLVLCHLGETETTFPRSPDLYSWTREKSVQDLGMGVKQLLIHWGCADTEALAVPACPHLPLLYILFLAEDPAYPQWLPLSTSHVVDPRVAGTWKHGFLRAFLCSIFCQVVVLCFSN